MLSAHAVGGRLKQKFREFVKRPAKPSKYRFSILSNSSDGSEIPMLKAECSRRTATGKSAATKAVDNLGGNDFSEPPLDSAVSSTFFRTFSHGNDGSLLTLPSLTLSTSSLPFSASTTSLSVEFSRSEKKLTRLEERLVKFVKWANLVEHAKSISPLLLQEIAQDSGALVEEFCDPEVMQQMVTSGLLKQIVDTELLRRLFEFFRLWVNLEALGEKSK